MAVKSNVAELSVEDDPSSGPAVIVVSGGVASIVNCLVSVGRVARPVGDLRDEVVVAVTQAGHRVGRARPEHAPNAGGDPLGWTLHWTEATPLV